MKSVRILVLNFLPSMIGVALLVAVAGMACLGAQDATASMDDDKRSRSANSANIADGGKEDPGISDGEVLFGQSAVFSGPSKALGQGMRLGIETAFHEANQAGGVHGRELRLKTLDDSYETDYAFHTTKWLIEKVGVFALIGAVGTPTTEVSSPVAHDAGVPFLAPFTGAEFLRDPALDNVVNLRASYYQETEEMIARLTEDLGITRVAVFYQDDSFGKSGLEGVRQALARRGLEPVGAWHYQRNSGAVRQAASGIIDANPEAVVMVGTEDAVATAIELVRNQINPVFVTMSFVGGVAFSDALGEDGHGVYVTQVVPFPEDASIPVVARYQAALSAYNPQAEPEFVSLEGYLAGHLAIFGLDACGRDLSRKCFIDALHNSEIIDIDGFRLKYGHDDNQGSDEVFLTVIGADGKYRQVEMMSR